MLRRLAVLLAGVVSLAIALIGFGGLSAVAFAEGETCPNEAVRVEQHATFLPDCRAYEMVSPANKNGGDVMSVASRTRASVTGNAINFASLTSFGDALGAGIATEYIAERDGTPGTNGWVTHSITPRIEPLSFSAAGSTKDTIYQMLSPDLSKGVIHSFTPLTTGAPNVESVSNIYLRNDLLSSGPGSYELLSNAFAPIIDNRGQYRPVADGASANFSRIIFEAARNLTSEALPFKSPTCVLFELNCQSRLYEWDEGIVRLAGILPDGTPAAESEAGPGAINKRYTPNAISADGSKIFFTVPDSSKDVFGDIYMRLHNGLPDASTVQINASERTDCADTSPCTGVPEPDPAGPQSAGYQAATPDGSKVFFTTSEQLVDADTNGQVNLYMYDTTLPASDPHKLTLINLPVGNSGVEGLAGVSDDGGYVYMVAEVSRLFVWHAGVASEIGSLGNGILDVLGPKDDWSLEGLGARGTPDGKTLLFTSIDGSGLLGYDHGSGCGAGGSSSCRELYVYRADTKTLTCASCNPTGAPATADATFTVATANGAAGFTSYLNHPLSEDGKHVFFETGERLVPQDVNGKHTDVYEYDVETGTLHLISPGTGEADSHFLDASPDGHDVFFTTNGRLVGWDSDNSYDLYDARVGGGLPEPPAPAAECVDQGCQGPPSGVPAPLSTQSGELGEGNGNLAAPLAPKARAKSLSRAQKLARALKACRERPKRKRRTCEAQARHSFGVLSASRSTTTTSKSKESK